jgi:hypothetical protein
MVEDPISQRILLLICGWSWSQSNRIAARCQEAGRLAAGEPEEGDRCADHFTGEPARDPMSSRCQSRGVGQEPSDHGKRP